MNNRVLWYFFVSSVWMFIALNGYKLISHAIKAESILGSYPGGYASRVFIAPFFLFFFELFLWFKMFRWSQRPARIFAGLVGGYIWLVAIFVNILVADIYGRDLPIALALLYAYTGLGHMTYAFFGKER